MKLDARQPNATAPLHLGGAVVCMALLAGGWLFGIEPMLAQTNAQSNVVQQADKAQKDAGKAKAGLDRVRAKLDKVKAELERQPISLESAEQINPLLGQLAKWSEQHALSITQTSAGRPIALMYYDYVPISLAGQGGYGDLLAMLHQLREGRRDLGVVSFSAKRMTTTQGAKVGFTIDLAWYVVAQDDDGEGIAEQDTHGERRARASVRIGG